MKRQTRIYNIIMPVWMLILFPQVLIFVIPGNLIVDCAVLFFTLLALKHAQKGAVLKKLWWRFWLLGFAADAVGIVWLFLGFALAAAAMDMTGAVDGWLVDAAQGLMANPFRHPLAFLWTLGGVAAAGVCIYFFDKRAMRSCALLSGREKHVTALAMAVATAPWLFFIPTRL